MKSVVLLSGGLDSTLALAMAVRDGHSVEALTVTYGQTHAREVEAAQLIAEHYGVSQVRVAVSPVLFEGSALTGGADIPTAHADAPDSTYVPARNTVLLALAAARAEATGAKNVIIGANAADEAGYPDCRRKFIEAYRDVLQLGTLNHVWVMAPLLELSKSDILRRAYELDVPVEMTWSCYRGGLVQCGLCGACEAIESAQKGLASL